LKESGGKPQFHSKRVSDLGGELTVSGRESCKAAKNSERIATEKPARGEASALSRLAGRWKADVDDVIAAAVRHLCLPDSAIFAPKVRLIW